MDLTHSFISERRYDLAISLEVAEHLPPHRAKNFVGLLTDLSDFILFPAAIPFQGGKNHVNEQWQDYWTELFESHAYILFDFIRGKIWKDDRIPPWYRQNILFFAQKDKASQIKATNGDDAKALKII